MKTLFAIIIIAATVAGAAPATNRMSNLKITNLDPAAHAATNRASNLKIATNRVQMIQGAPVAKTLLKTQPKAAVRVKDAVGRTRDLPIMFNNNKLKKGSPKK